MATKLDLTEFGGAPQLDLSEFEPAPKAGAVRRLGDWATGFAGGALGATKAVADVAGAGNIASRGLGAAAKGVEGLLSPAAQADAREQAAIMEESKGKGVLSQVGAGLRAFGVAPMQTTMGGLGSIVPTLAAAAATGGASLPVSLGSMAAIGAAQGAGGIKGGIYDDVKKRSLEAGSSPAEAEAAAVRAQEFTGPNTSQIALGGALGTGDALTGVTRVAGGMLRRGLGQAGGEIAEGSSRGLLARTALGVAGEVPLEAAQGGQQQYATNVASQRAGFDVNPWEGVASQATLEALASAGPGAAFGALNSARPAVPVVAPADAPQRPTDVPPDALSRLALPAPAAGPIVVNPAGVAVTATQALDETNAAAGRRIDRGVEAGDFTDISKAGEGGYPAARAEAQIRQRMLGQPDAPIGPATAAIADTPIEALLPAPDTRSTSDRMTEYDEADSYTQGIYDQVFGKPDATEAIDKKAGSPLDSLLDDNIPWDEDSNVDEPTFLARMGFSDEEIRDAAAANRPSREKASSQSSPGTAPAQPAGPGERAPAPQAGDQKPKGKAKAKGVAKVGSTPATSASAATKTVAKPILKAIEDSPASRWTRMPTAERAALATRINTGLIGQRMARTAWDDLSPEAQTKLTSFMDAKEPKNASLDTPKPSADTGRSPSPVSPRSDQAVAGPVLGTARGKDASGDRPGPGARGADDDAGPRGVPGSVAAGGGRADGGVGQGSGGQRADAKPAGKDQLGGAGVDRGARAPDAGADTGTAAAVAPGRPTAEQPPKTAEQADQTPATADQPPTKPTSALSQPNPAAAPEPAPAAALMNQIVNEVWKKGQTARAETREGAQGLTTPDVFTLTPDQITALEGKTIDITVAVGDSGNTATMTLDAAAAVRDIQTRHAAAQKLMECMK